MFAPFTMKYFIVSCLLAVVAAAPQYNPYNQYAYNPYRPDNYSPYHAQPYGYNPYQPNPYYRNPTGYYPGAVHHQQYQAPAVAETREARPDGSYSYSYQTVDGQQVHSEGALRVTGPEGATPAVHGSYSYNAPDGTPVTVNYVADEYGYRAHGPQIPNADAIDQSIAQNLQSERYHHGAVPFVPSHK
ncbi:hypothetical protein PPYR_09321 [Photinus pyralis]|uniref:Uncharacterized protein n=2 Tax=Photinus pyralis TaxID=7054 RepID=A0A5N4AM89_PHOPY|nr:endocuticle structural glycoprotein SgAbd-2-like [Photinus pyralis]KAB0798328.1 hypothetical protein PPYR_09321 [Photinus pyralis]